MKTILVVDDEKSIRDLIKLTLQIENYNVELAKDGEEAFNMIQSQVFDLILLDIMIPKINGLELIKMLEDKNIPVIFITAKESLQDKIIGLKLGAEDYITKPFEPLELLARVEVILRRNNKISKVNIDNIIKFKNIVINKDQRQVKIDKREIYLTAKEYELLLKFIENKNIVLTRESLIDSIWEYDFLGETRTVDMHVKQLREKLDLKDDIITVYKVGYKLKDVNEK